MALNFVEEIALLKFIQFEFTIVCIVLIIEFEISTLKIISQ